MRERHASRALDLLRARRDRPRSPAAEQRNELAPSKLIQWHPLTLGPRLYSRPGNHLTDRFPLIVEALRRLGARSCIVDGEAVACGEDGIASFERMRDTPCASLHPKAYWTKVSPVDRCETTRT